jgi:predicted AlkP superfamily phosphohydrolase/phosphomutase
LGSPGWIGLVTLTLLLGVACSDGGRERVLLIGIDGAAPRLVEPMLREGALPHLSGLAERGLYRKLLSHHPIESPRIWTSMATGVLPRRHGIESFGFRDEQGGRHLFTSAHRKVPALWNILTAASRSVGVANWWNSYPPEAIDGVIVSDHLLTRDVLGRQRITGAETATVGSIASPEGWDERVRELLADDTPLTGIENPFADPERFPGWEVTERLAQRFENDADVVRVALAIEREIHPDVMMVFLPGIDRVSHMLWATVEPEEAYDPPIPMTPVLRAAGLAAMREYYRYTDALIGTLLEGYGDRDLVLVVSDHGFEAGRKLAFLTGVHDSEASVDGVIFAAGPGVQAPSDPRRISVNDVTPTVLAWLGLPVARDMDGRPASFLTGREVSWVESYASTPVERPGSRPSGAEEDILEELESLGYIERDDSH